MGNMRAIRFLAVVLVATGATLGVATCGGDGGTTPTPPDPTPPANRAPTAVGAIAAQTVVVGASATVDVAANFSDPDGDALTYAAASSSDAVATASVSGSTVTVEGVSAGTATVTVTARDPAGLSATRTIDVTVEAANQAPVAEGAIDDLTLVAGAEATVDVTANFSDPDGDELAHAATSSDTAVATVTVAGAVVTIAAVAPGSATVTVTATDPGELSATQQFGVTVEAPNQAPVAEGAIFDLALVAGIEATLDVTANFSDPDGDELTYAATSSDTAVATAFATGATVTVMAVAPGDATVTVTATDPGELAATQSFDVAVAPPAMPPTIAETIPTHDLIVDSMVVLDLSPYFEEGDLTYAATTSDEAVAVASVEGGAVTTTGTGAVEDSVSVALLSVTATNEHELSVTQDSIMVRVHREPYDTLAGISVNEDGTISSGALTLSTCLNIVVPFPVGGTTFRVFWSEWQRAVGGGWVTAQNNVRTDPVLGPVNICPIRIGEDRFPPGTYRLVGHIEIGGVADFLRSSTIEKKP